MYEDGDPYRAETGTSGGRGGSFSANKWRVRGARGQRLANSIGLGLSCLVYTECILAATEKSRRTAHLHEPPSCLHSRDRLSPVPSGECGTAAFMSPATSGQQCCADTFAMEFQTKHPFSVKPRVRVATELLEG